MNKRIRNFFTLTRRANDGFTLVELIVVIAILAILGGVAIPAYSAYVTRANKQADISLASEVAHALSLQYYNNGGEGAGYVILGDNASAGNAFSEEAMKATFGENWADMLELKYDSWELNGNLPSKADADKVANSSYYQNSTPAELVSSFTGLTDALAEMSSTADQDPLDTMKTASVMTDEEITAMRAQLDDLGVSWDKDKGAYTTAVSNLLVQNVATEISGYKYEDDEEMSALGGLAVAYAQIYAWGTTGDAQGAAVLEELNKAIAAEDADSTSVMAAVDKAMETATADDSTFYTYLEKKEMDDLQGLSSIMGTVSNWSDGADMTTSGLYSSDSITDAVNNYITAVGSMSGMTPEEANALADALENGVVVYISSDGTVSYNISLD